MAAATAANTASESRTGCCPRVGLRSGCGMAEHRSASSARNQFFSAVWAALYFGHDGCRYVFLTVSVTVSVSVIVVDPSGRCSRFRTNRTA